MWRSLNEVMERNGMVVTNFKGFIGDSAQANWNAIQIIYNSGNLKTEMLNREWMCLLHWNTSMHQHTQKLIKLDMQQQHTCLCKQYKDSKTKEEARTCYLAI